MAIAKDGVKNVQIEGVKVWAAPDGCIHLQANDPDKETKEQFWITFSPKQGSVNYHAPTYRKLVLILTRPGRVVPGWEGEPAS